MPHSKPRILILGKSLFNSLDHVHSNKYLKLGDQFTCEFTGVTLNKDFQDATHQGFIIRCVYIPRLIRNKKLFLNILFFCKCIASTIYRHYKNGQYYAIIVREPLFAGPIGLIIAKLTGSKLVVELNGNYASKYVWEEIPSLFMRTLKHNYSKLFIPLVLKNCDAIKTLYPEQERPYIKPGRKNHPPVYCFHDYTNISNLPEPENNGNFILSMGHPYEIKGFDILIKAFNQISDQFPDIELHLVGHMRGNDREELEEIKQNNPRIHILPPLKHQEAMEKLSKCFFSVLASRTEAMGRVLLESMALRKAVIATKVDGIPHYIKNEYNGILVEPENIDVLADALILLIKDKDLRQQLANNGYSYVHQNLSETEYLHQYISLLKALQY